jgi:hypothetical protein
VPTSDAGTTRSSSDGPVQVTRSVYGAISISAVPGTECRVEVDVDRGVFGDRPPPSPVGTADASGVLLLIYPAPRVPAGTGRHVVTCGAGGQSHTAVADFAIPPGPLDARGFTTRIERVEPTAMPAGVSTRADPSLLDARDEIARYLVGVLTAEWRRATRGLGALTLVGSSADVVLYVLPARGTSVNQRSSDGTERVLLYVGDAESVISRSMGLSIALHELGHTWCCFGPEAGPDEHWLERRLDPDLVGVNRYGLMVHPVLCREAAGQEVCASRFSERDLRAMGFVDIPMPLPDTCSARLRELDAQIGALDGALEQSSRAIDSDNQRLAVFAAELRAIESRYAGAGMPLEARATYQRVAEEYDELYRETTASVRQYNDIVRSRNDAAGSRAGLAC